MASDNFNRADANPLDGNWAQPSGLSAIQIVSNQVVVSSVNSNSGAYSTVSSVGASYVEITDVTGRNGGPAIRMDASGNGYCLLNWDAGNFYIYLFPSFSVIGFGSGLTYQIGDIIGLREGSGNVKIASQNGVDVLTSSADTTYLTGAPGIFLYNELGVDNWTDGAGGGGGSTSLLARRLPPALRRF